MTLKAIANRLPPDDQQLRTYVALKQLRIGPDDIRDFGDPVPEANEWPSSVVAAMLHLEQLGQGPAPCAHEPVLADLAARLAALETQYSTVAAERDEFKEKYDSAQDDIADLEDELETAKKRLGDDKKPSGGKGT